MFRTLFISLVILSALASEGASGLTGVLYNDFDVLSERLFGLETDKESQQRSYAVYSDASGHISANFNNEIRPVFFICRQLLPTYTEPMPSEPFINTEVPSFIKEDKKAIMEKSDSSPPYSARRRLSTI